MAATGQAPAPSTAVFTRSNKNKIDSAISDSFTVTTSSTYSSTSWNVKVPGVPTAIPSAKLLLAGTVTK